MVEAVILADTIAYTLIGIMLTAGVVGFYYTYKAIQAGEFKRKQSDTEKKK